MIITNQHKIMAGVAAASIAGVTGFILYKKNKSKRDVTKEIQNYGKATVGTVNVIETAAQLGLDLGLAYGWWNPQSWTENDKAVRDTLKAFPKELMPLLVKEFNKKYNKSLQAECQRLLPASYYQEIRAKFL